jgi:hypothetical protein
MKSSEFAKLSRETRKDYILKYYETGAINHLSHPKLWMCKVLDQELSIEALYMCYDAIIVKLSL